MRKRKRIAAVILAMCMLLGVTPALAVEMEAGKTPKLYNADKAATLKDLGLYEGTDATDVAAGLDGALTTQDSLIFLAKLFGYSEAANAMTSEQVASALSKFDDAAYVSDYAVNTVAYAAQTNILNGSTRDGKFFIGAKDTVTAARFATFMLKQMGYTVADYKESVAKLAEAKGSKVAATVSGDLTRDEAVGVMYGALTAEKASGRTVIQDIVGNDTELKNIADKAGLLVESASQQLQVESVMALNTKQLSVVFSQYMDKTSVETESFYEIKDKNANLIQLSEGSAVLGADKRTVTITLDRKISDRLTNSSTAGIVIKAGIRAEDGQTLSSDYINYTLSVQDGVIPSLRKAEGVGERRIKLTFSEPVLDNSGLATLKQNQFQVVSVLCTESHAGPGRYLFGTRNQADRRPRDGDGEC